MKIGLHQPFWLGPSKELAQAAEHAGFESLWLPEHLIMPLVMHGRPGSPHQGEPPISGDTEAWDPFVHIAFLAGQTSTIRLGTNVFNVGLRHPIVTARALTTADLISGGRIELGIGASWLAEEWQVMQLPFSTRGRRMDESINIIQRLCTEDIVAYEGEFFNFQAVKFLPKPVQSPWPPILIGGDSTAAMRRAAQLGDGWIPMSQNLETLPINLKRISEMREDSGRAHMRFEVTIPLFSPDDASITTLRRLEQLGVDRVLVTPFHSQVDALEGIQRFGDSVLSAIRIRQE